MDFLQTLRPLSTGEILDRAIRLYRNHFLSLVGITAFLLAPMTFIEVVAQMLFEGGQLVTLLENGFVMCFVQGSLAYAISCAYLNQPFSIGSAYQAGLRRYWSLWGSIFLEGLAIGVPVAVLTFALLAVGGAAVAVLLILIFVPYAIFLSTRWLISIPGIMLEDLGASEGLRRSWNLTSGMFWRVLGVSLVVGLLTFLIAQLPAMAVTYGFLYFFPGDRIGPILELTMAGLGSILTLPLSLGVMVLLYYDLRVRREGFDLQMQAQEMSAGTGEPV